MRLFYALSITYGSTISYRHQMDEKRVPSPSRRSDEVELPRLHRDMEMICDVFRVSEQSRNALRSFDCTVLEGE